MLSKQNAQKIKLNYYQDPLTSLHPTSFAYAQISSSSDTLPQLLSSYYPSLLQGSQTIYCQE